MKQLCCSIPSVFTRYNSHPSLLYRVRVRKWLFKMSMKENGFPLRIFQGKAIFYYRNCGNKIELFKEKTHSKWEIRSQISQYNGSTISLPYYLKKLPTILSKFHFPFGKIEVTQFFSFLYNFNFDFSFLAWNGKYANKF